MDSKGGKPRPVSPEGSGGVRVSPDGKYALGALRSRLVLFPLAGGEPIECKGAKEGERAVDWSADGVSVFTRPAQVQGRGI